VPARGLEPPTSRLQVMEQLVARYAALFRFIP
jgi:hypothetical protein